MTIMYSPLYLRDLSNDLRMITENDIRKNGSKEIIEALDAGYDITIGEYYKVENYTK